jgi:hypothetical protein
LQRTFWSLHSADGYSCEYRPQARVGMGETCEWNVLSSSRRRSGVVWHRPTEELWSCPRLLNWLFKLKWLHIWGTSFRQCVVVREVMSMRKEVRGSSALFKSSGHMTFNLFLFMVFEDEWNSWIYISFALARSLKQNRCSPGPRGVPFVQEGNQFWDCKQPDDRCFVQKLLWVFECATHSQIEYLSFRKVCKRFALCY